MHRCCSTADRRPGEPVPARVGDSTTEDGRTGVGWLEWNRSQR